jgi:hypothetical protein
MARLNNLAMLCSNCAVVALTGDCVSLSRAQVPSEWDAWPQPLKLSVPGNHDQPGTFDPLRSWQYQTPWAWSVDGLAFVGPNSYLPERVEEYLRGLDLGNAKGFVFVFHERPHDTLLSALGSFVASKPLLILHGHEHPSDFSGSEWDQDGRIGGKQYFRSKVCSSVSRCRGLGHVITWTEESFRCRKAQGPRIQTIIGPPQAPKKHVSHAVAGGERIVEHPEFGMGILVKREDGGLNEKLLIDFPCFGTLKILAAFPGLRFLE